jgi:hypothetical protein
MLDAQAVRAVMPEEAAALGLEPDETRDLLRRVDAALAGNGGRRCPPQRAHHAADNQALAGTGYLAGNLLSPQAWWRDTMSSKAVRAGASWGPIMMPDNWVERFVAGRLAEHDEHFRLRRAGNAARGAKQDAGKDRGNCAPG